MGPWIGGPLVGRAPEREDLILALARSRDPSGAKVLIEGEPGIGKSPLLLELAQIAASERSAVVDARASEFERDLPYALWSEAIDGHLRQLGERQVRLLGIADPRALTVITPALEGERDAAPVADRHRTHRAVRDLLERIAAARPLVLCLDTVRRASLMGQKPPACRGADRHGCLSPASRRRFRLSLCGGRWDRGRCEAAQQRASRGLQPQRAQPARYGQ